MKTNNLLEAIQKGISEALDFNIDNNEDDFSIQKTKPSYATIKSIDNAQKKINDCVKENDYVSAYNLYATYNVKYSVANKQELEDIIKLVTKMGSLPDSFDYNWIDVINVTDMSELFDNSKKHTIMYDISKWDVSNVENMCGMFIGNTINYDLSQWNVSKVSNMSFMFVHSNINFDISCWDVSNVKNMYAMFWGCENLNQPLNDWNVSNVTNMDSMFYNCKSFNQPLDNWNTHNVTTMSEMFSGCARFNQPLNNWNVSNVTNMSNMFQDCTDFNQPLNNWNVSNVTRMSGIFENCKNFIQNISNWNIINVKNIDDMFIPEFPYEFRPIVCDSMFEYNNGHLIISNKWCSKLSPIELKILYKIIDNQNLFDITQDKLKNSIKTYIQMHEK